MFKSRAALLTLLAFSMSVTVNLGFADSAILPPIQQPLFQGSELFPRAESTLSDGSINSRSTRSGTENWEQPQHNFFVIPGLFILIGGLLLYLNRDKSE